MTAPIGPGDWVECIGTGSPAIPHGSVWLCLDIIDTPSNFCRSCGDCPNTLILKGDPLASVLNGCGLCPNHFRPIYHPSATFLQSLLEPVRVDA